MLYQAIVEPGEPAAPVGLCRGDDVLYQQPAGCWLGHFAHPVAGGLLIVDDDDQSEHVCELGHVSVWTGRRWAVLVG